MWRMRFEWLEASRVGRILTKKLEYLVEMQQPNPNPNPTPKPNPNPIERGSPLETPRQLKKERSSLVQKASNREPRKVKRFSSL